MQIATAKTLAKLIVDNSSKLKFVVGSGETTWDNLAPPKFPDSKETLYNETYRTNIQSIKYVNPTTYEDSPSNAVTNAIKVVGLIPASSTIDNTYIREKALFYMGETRNTGNMLHAETTSLETKTNGKEFETTMIIVIR